MKQGREVKIKVGHNKPHFPSKDNAEKYIHNTVYEAVKKCGEIHEYHTSAIGNELMVTVSFNIISIADSKIDSLEGKLRKVLRNIGKRYNTSAGTFEISLVKEVVPTNFS